MLPGRILVFGQVISRNHGDFDVGIIRFHLPEELKTASPRQTDIRKNDMRRDIGDLFERVLRTYHVR